MYKYETSTLTPFVKPRSILNLAIQNVFYIQSYVESAFMYNPGSTKTTSLFLPKTLIMIISSQNHWTRDTAHLVLQLIYLAFSSYGILVNRGNCS